MTKEINIPGWEVYSASIVDRENITFFLARNRATLEKRIGVLGGYSGLLGSAINVDGTFLYKCSSDNAAVLRKLFLWLRPQPLSLNLSAGCGDRLGLATPGHIRAICRAGRIAPVLAQQSMRENQRTGRTPQNVVDDAMWGVFEAGFRRPWGADADHLKTQEDIDLCAKAGYSLYTIDPGAYVDNEAHLSDLPALREKLKNLPWEELETSLLDLQKRFSDRIYQIEKYRLTFSEIDLHRAICKYGRAIAHTVRMYKHLSGVMGDQPFELEVSVDETETPTSHFEHILIASELRRLQVRWVGLAPRYLGEFEKGVDYIGSIEKFQSSFAIHAAIARVLGPYKLSLHSGSDKFSIYSIAANETRGLVHLKTAGTSYLEALRVIARREPLFFKEILMLARQYFERDKATYHISADLLKVPSSQQLQDGKEEHVLDSFDGREVLHVTFGTILDQYGERLKNYLCQHEDEHYSILEEHFIRHFFPFVSADGIVS